MFKKETSDHQKLYDILKSKVQKDPKETFQKFSGTAKYKSSFKIKPEDFKRKIGPNVNYSYLKANKAINELKQPHIRIISCHPSCLGRGDGPISVYTKNKNNIKKDILIEDAKFTI